MNIHRSVCPVCGSSDFSDILKAKDFTVSGERFAIVQCNTCSLRFTQDFPSEDSIGQYYQAEDYISHSDKSKGIITKLYHAVRSRTLNQKKKLLNRYRGERKRSILDIGAGVGAFMQTMAEDGWKVTGLEPDAGARKIAREKYGQLLEESERLFFLPEESFDAVTMWHVLEHVHNLEGYTRKIYNLLKPEGKWVIAVPNYTSPDAHFYGEYWAAYDVPRHLYHFSPLSMTTLLTNNGFQLLDVKPMWFDSFYVSMLSEQYKSGASNLPGAFLKGLSSNLQALRHVQKCSSLIYIAGKVNSSR